MLSNKLTFSLASLIVLLMIGLCVPVGAQQIIDPGDFLIIGRGDLTAANAARSGLGMDPDLTADNYLQDNALPDLEMFFRLGGTVELLITTADGNGATAGTPLDDAIGAARITAFRADPAPRVPVKSDLVISEIMWGLDVDPQAAAENFALNSNRKQWVEIYNTSDRAILLAAAGSETQTVLGTGATAGHVTTAGSVSISLKFTSYTLQTTADANNVLVSDRVSNVGTGGKWTMPGSNGVTELIDRQNAPSQSNVVSAYRNIDYPKVTGVHKLTPNNTVDAAANRTEQLKGIPDGTLAGSWKETPAAGSRNMDRWHIGTPNMMHVPDTNFTFAITRTSIPSNSVVINEIRNSGQPGEDWVELYNAGTTAVGLRDWELSIIKGTNAAKTDVRLVGKDKDDDDSKRFPPNDVFKLKPGEYLLIVERHPSETSLANGVNIEAAAEGRDVKAGAMHQYIVRPSLDLDGVKMLLLRNALDKNSYHNKDDSGRNYETNKAPSEKIMDYAGAGFIAVDSSTYNTAVWPFRGWTKPGDTEGIPSGNAFARKRYNANDGHHKDAWDNVGHKGGIGYDPGVDLRDAPGTPGYANGALKDKLINKDDGKVVFGGEISISEVMVDAGPRWNLIQWIELYNASMTEVVNLKDWEMEIRNATDDVESYVDSGFVFNDAYILPNQTLLIVSGTAVNDVKDNRVYNLYQHHRRQLGLTNRRSVLLSPTGFYLKLTDKNDDVVDEAGNVMVDGAARNVMWELPESNVDMRQSLVRQYGTRELYDGSPDMADDGTMMDSWRQSDIVGAGISFYGHRDDVGTPGFRLGGPLPVELSSFRPVRNEQTGHVDITWITQSELNNAGFNVLRSEAKTGDFKVVNVKGIIAGHGTTSEKHVYTFTDTTAKPNVVYYYQIEDVSLDGNRTTLATTHLRGNVSAAGKLTTTWGDLKTQ